MRSSTASRAVRMSTGTRLPDERSRRQTSRPSMSGMPMSSTTASGTSVAIFVSPSCPPSASTTS